MFRVDPSIRESVIDLRSNDGSSRDGGEDIISEIFSVRIPGNPQPYPRVRINFGGHFYNPVSKKLSEFKEKVRKELPAYINGNIPFAKGVPVCVKIGFFMQRPLGDFVGRRRSPGNLKPTSLERKVVPHGADVDNLVKFVLDALNGVIYHDDTQVVAVEAYKLPDNFMDCLGATVVEISEFDSTTDIPKFLNN